MKKYKLIKWYPTCLSLKEGQIVTEWTGSTCYSLTRSSLFFSPSEVENNPGFWQEVVEADFEILSIEYDGQIYKKSNEIVKKPYCKGQFKYKGENLGGWMNAFDPKDSSKIHKNVEIHSIKRLSDGKVFTIGDEVCLALSWETIPPCVIQDFRLDKKGKIVFNISQDNASATYPEKLEEFYHKPTYKILSFLSCLSGSIPVTRKDNEKFSINEEEGLSTEKELLNNERMSIHSIKRLSDDEVFTVGDNVNIRSNQNPCCEQTVIQDLEFWLKEIHKLSHIKKPLFTTEDGVDIFTNTEYWTINTSSLDWKIQNYTAYNSQELSPDSLVAWKKDNMKCFSTKEAAEEYIKSQVVLTTNDGVDIYPGGTYYWTSSKEFAHVPANSVCKVTASRKRDCESFPNDYFSTEAKCRNFILNRMECLSINEIIDAGVFPSSNTVYKLRTIVRAKTNV